MRISVFYLTPLGYKKLQKNFRSCQLSTISGSNLTLFLILPKKQFFVKYFFLLAVSSGFSVSVNAAGKNTPYFANYTVNAVFCQMYFYFNEEDNSFLTDNNQFAQCNRTVL